MLKLGIIGTNWITAQFVEAAIASNAYQLHSVYSRQETKGLVFGEPFDCQKVFTDLALFLADEALEIVYIASPNSLHYPQAKAAILAGKHVITEKPAVSRLVELEELHALAKEKGVFYFEAARNIHEENFKEVADLLPSLAPIVAANFSYMKYSSRFPQVLAGEEPNIFSPKFSGGALMDLGIYLVYATVAWFGKPEEVHYFARKMSTGVDAVGHMIFRYPSFDVNLMTGKTSTSFLPSEIIGQDKTLLLNATNSIETISLYEHEGDRLTEIPVGKEDNPMIEEARAFAEIINQKDINAPEYLALLELMHTVHKLIEEMRHQAGIVFSADVTSE